VAKRRLTRKEVKQPDQFVSSSVQVITWTKSHTKQFLYGAIGTIVVVGLVTGWSIWQKQRRQQAERLLYEAVKVFNNVNKSVQKPTTEQTIGHLQNLIQNYSRTPAAALAYWYLGHLYFEQGNHMAALAAYEQAQHGLSADRGRLLPALVRLNIGYVQEITGACNAALASFETVLQSSVDWLHGEAFLGMGRCYENMNVWDKATEVYSRALSDRAVNSTIRQTLEERLSFFRTKKRALSESTPEKATQLQ
jgi:predicted negative regulator of RcsB-dependent stress response